MVCCLLLGGLMLLGPDAQRLWRAIRGRTGSGERRGAPAEVGVARHLVVAAPGRAGSAGPS